MHRTPAPEPERMPVLDEVVSRQSLAELAAVPFKLALPPEQTAQDSLSEGSFGEVEEMVSQPEFSEVDDWRPWAG